MSRIQLFDLEIAIGNTLALSGLLLLPVILALGLLIFGRPSYFERTGMMLGLLWAIPFLTLFNILAQSMGWWIYTDTVNMAYGIPLELLLGWAVFWGVILPFLFRGLPIFIPIAFAFGLDVMLMPLLNGLFTLGESWLVGEMVLLVCVLWPALIIFRLTADRTHVIIRALLQSLIWGGWIVFLIPAAVLSFQWIDIFSFMDWSLPKLSAFLFFMSLFSVLGYAALWEFAVKGQGTPIPFDPPKNLVSTGVYAYVANPLQISTFGLFATIAFAYESWLMVFPIVTHILYCEILVRWHHSVDIERRFGDDWKAYKTNVRNWIPRFTAYQGA